MHEKPKLRVTKDYDIFEMHEVNRDITERPLLLASMKAHGFMPSKPIQCVPIGGGKFKVIVGHHRLDYARRLKQSVWYVVDESNTDIYELEADGRVRWSLRDFLSSRAKAGDEGCQRVLAFQQKHGLTQSVTISLLGGSSAGSLNYNEQVKRGAFKLAAEPTHARAVVDVTDYFRTCGITFATRAGFVMAVSMVLRVPEFDARVLKHRMSQAPNLIQKRTSTEGYLDELEALYNYGAKGKRLALKFRALEVGRERRHTFGGKNKPKHLGTKG